MSKKELTYKSAYLELEKIVSQIENNEIDVDELAVKVKRAAELLTFCKSKLTESELEISKVINKISENEE